MGKLEAALTVLYKERDLAQKKLNALKFDIDAHIKNNKSQYLLNLLCHTRSYYTGVIKKYNEDIDYVLDMIEHERYIEDQIDWLNNL